MELAIEFAGRAVVTVLRPLSWLVLYVVGDVVLHFVDNAFSRRAASKRRRLRTRGSASDEQH